MPEACYWFSDREEPSPEQHKTRFENEVYITQANTITRANTVTGGGAAEEITYSRSWIWNKMVWFGSVNYIKQTGSLLSPKECVEGLVFKIGHSDIPRP